MYNFWTQKIFSCKREGRRIIKGLIYVKNPSIIGKDPEVHDTDNKTRRFLQCHKNTLQNQFLPLRWTHKKHWQHISTIQLCLSGKDKLIKKDTLIQFITLLTCTWLQVSGLTSLPISCFCYLMGQKLLPSRTTGLAHLLVWKQLSPRASPPIAVNRHIQCLSKYSLSVNSSFNYTLVLHPYIGQRKTTVWLKAQQ